MKKGLVLIAALISITTVFYACKKAPGPDTTPVTGGFDKTIMLTHYADDLIIPGYTAMKEKLAQLQAASDGFLTSPSATTQAAVKTAYKDAHLQYQRIVAFQFGPAESALLDIYVNYSGGLDYSFATAGQLTGFSIDSATIENNIATGTYDLSAVSRTTLYSQGFPALNYLYFSPDAIAKFSSNTANRVKYVKDVLNRIKALVDKVAADWVPYRQEFISNTKTSNGSPIANIINQMAYQMDMIKGPRIGWPLGKQSNGIVFASKCEAYFAGISVALAIENLSSLKRIYTGGGSEKGISDYLVALNKASLNNDVLTQFDMAIAKLQLIPDPLSVSLTNDAATVDAAYKEIQKLLTLLKTDVASATAVQITFTDNDGD
jgi:predicted lipoprotein